MEGVNFIITVRGTPQAIKEKLLAMPSNPFSQKAHIFSYRRLNGEHIHAIICEPMRTRRLEIERPKIVEGDWY